MIAARHYARFDTTLSANGGGEFTSSARLSLGSGRAPMRLLNLCILTATNLNAGAISVWVIPTATATPAAATIANLTAAGARPLATFNANATGGTSVSQVNGSVTATGSISTPFAVPDGIVARDSEDFLIEVTQTGSANQPITVSVEYAAGLMGTTPASPSGG